MQLTDRNRAHLAKAIFGLPGERKYPMEDKAHAANAKARATQMLHDGHITPAQHAEIAARADKVLAG